MTSELLRITRSFTLQVTHQSAVMSRKTSRPAAERRSASARSNGCQTMAAEPLVAAGWRLCAAGVARAAK